MKTAILIDSGCDVSEELVQRYHMKVMRLHVIYPEGDYIDAVSYTHLDVYKRQQVHPHEVGKVKPAVRHTYKQRAPLLKVGDVLT